MSQSDLTANMSCQRGHRMEGQVRSGGGTIWLFSNHGLAQHDASRLLVPLVQDFETFLGIKKQMHKRLALKAKQLNMTITMCIEVAISRHTTYSIYIYSYTEKWCLWRRLTTWIKYMKLNELQLHLKTSIPTAKYKCQRHLQCFFCFLQRLRMDAKMATLGIKLAEIKESKITYHILPSSSHKIF